MPGVGAVLTDARIAELVTFVRRSFGGPTQVITAERVAEVRHSARDRSSYWTAEELLADSQ
jgi:mono/diheme cytochrome c family protein